MATDLGTPMAALAAAPRCVVPVGHPLLQHSLPDLIAADVYRKQGQGLKKTNRGVAFSKLLPAGPVSDQQMSVAVDPQRFV